MQHIYPIPGFQEPFSCFTHLFAAPVFAVLGIVLIRRGRRNHVRTWSLTVLTLTTVFLLSMSGVYHLLGPGTGRFVMRQLDISGVFGLIAGTITPVHAILFRGVGRWGTLLLFWAAAATGITLRAVFPEGLPYGMGTGIFLVMGWGGAFSFIALWRRYGFEFVSDLLHGGLAYSVGAAILLLDAPVVIPGVVCAHELWHLAVLTGLSFHWKFVFRIAGATTPAPKTRLGDRPAGGPNHGPVEHFEET